MITEELTTFGETLKQKRKERSLSLKEVENATSIRMNYLRAIENGDFNKLISPVYAQGFIRQYASFLGLDGESILREHPEFLHRQEAQEFSYGIGTLEKRGNPGAGVKWVPNALWVGAFVLALVVAWYFARFLEVI
ncbi:MAG: helix-turn-helix domain-containing protein [Waddliaceae bacterium]